MSNKWLNNIGRLIKYQVKNKTDEFAYFVIFERQRDKDKKYIGDSPFPITINEGDTLQAKLKSADLQRLVESGKMTEATAKKICESVKFEFSRAPARNSDDKKTEAPKSENKSTSAEDIDF